VKRLAEEEIKGNGYVEEKIIDNKKGQYNEYTCQEAIDSQKRGVRRRDYKKSEIREI
jgi:hypothetical protein